MNRIGLKEKEAKKLAKDLNLLLANYQLFYSNVRGFHWNVRGEKFFELHLKFEELYNDLFLKIDEVAERILTLGETPMHTFEDYLKSGNIPVAKDYSSAKETVGSILQSFETLLVQQRALLKMSGEFDDEGTNALMSDYIREQEKLVWMYSAYMDK